MSGGTNAQHVSGRSLNRLVGGGQTGHQVRSESADSERLASSRTVPT